MDTDKSKDVRYWSITVDFGNGRILEYGGTAFSDEQVQEQVKMALNGITEKIERG